MRRDTYSPTRRPPRGMLAAIAGALGLLVLSACGGDNLSLCDGCGAPTPTPTVTPSATLSATPTITPTPAL
jgi:hypothetical protein